MITRVRLASVAFVLLCASAAVSFAQQTDTTAVAHRGLKPRIGAVGAQVGVSGMYLDGDYSKGAMNRFSFAGSFRYVATEHWGWQINPYYTWAAYKVNTPTPFRDPAFPLEPYKDHQLSQLAGASAQLLFMSNRGPFTTHLGVGPAVYRVWLENHRKVVKDPVTFDRHRATYMGATVELGTEYFLRALTTTTLNATLAWHTAFAKDDARFPSGYSDSPQVFELRVGGNYYFDLGPGKKPGTKPATSP